MAEVYPLGRGVSVHTTIKRLNSSVFKPFTTNEEARISLGQTLS